jgi:hypothetical protein
MMGDYHVRFRERLGGEVPLAYSILKKYIVLMDFDSLISQEADKTQVYIAYGLVMNQVQECELAMVQMYYAIKLIKGKIRSVKDKD